MPKILFVCTGNICRSSGAEAVLRHQAEQAGRKDEFTIDSAGTHGYHVGDPPDRRGIAAAKKRGVSMVGQKARQFEVADFKKFDHVIAMDRGHYNILARMSGAQEQVKLQMFADYCTRHDMEDVPDPYYGDEQGFEDVLDILEDGVEGILSQF